MFLYLCNVSCAKFLSLRSSSIRYKEFVLFLILWRRSNDIGAITQFDKFLTLLMATYDSLATRSLLPRAIQANSRVNPCDLWIVVAHVKHNGSWCLSYCFPETSIQTVIGEIGTRALLSEQNDGPV